MEDTFLKKLIALILAFVFCLPLLSGCSKPPELAAVKDELISVIEKSYEVNEILFGNGLVTEYELSGVVEEYTDEIKNYENYYSDEQIYFNIYSPVVKTYMKDTDGDGVGDTETAQPTSVAEIKALAEKVYSSSFLNKNYVQIFEGGNIEINGRVESIKPRYRENFDAPDDMEGMLESEKVLRKYKYIDANKMDYIGTRGGRTVYDYSTMKIVKPSNATTIVVEVLGLYQDNTLDTSSENYDEWVSTPTGYSWHTVKLTFVLEGGAWKLDGASY